MSAKLKDISFEQAKENITKDYYFNTAMKGLGALSNPMVWTIGFSMIILLFSWLATIHPKPLTFLLYWGMGIILLMNILVLLPLLLIRDKHLIEYKRNLSSSIVFLFFGFLLFLIIIIMWSVQFFQNNKIILLILWLCLSIFLFLIIFYNFHNAFDDTYKQYGVIVVQSTFNKWYRRLIRLIGILAIVLAYLFRNVPGSHGSTAPEWIQMIGILILPIVFINGPFSVGLISNNKT